MTSGPVKGRPPVQIPRSGCCWRDQREDLGDGPFVRATIQEAHPLAWSIACGGLLRRRQGDLSVVRRASSESARFLSKVRLGAVGLSQVRFVRWIYFAVPPRSSSSSSSSYLTLTTPQIAWIQCRGGGTPSMLPPTIIHEDFHSQNIGPAYIRMRLYAVTGTVCPGSPR